MFISEKVTSFPCLNSYHLYNLHWLLDWNYINLFFTMISDDFVYKSCDRYEAHTDVVNNFCFLHLKPPSLMCRRSFVCDASYAHIIISKLSNYVKCFCHKYSVVWQGRFSIGGCNWLNITLLPLNRKEW